MYFAKHSSKGVSPIIATIILILIAVSAGVLLWLWVSTFTSSAPATQSQTLRERIKIEAVSVNTTAQQIQITAYVRNIGDVPIQIASAYILDISGNVINASEITGKTIQPGQLDKIQIDISKTSLSPGFSYRLKLVTSNGVESEYIFVYSS
ncbi:MAG: archaellin/type IV pilin N-terminal domain-containing protein [Ignisphaera sp.]